jgi:zinc protease
MFPYQKKMYNQNMKTHYSSVKKYLRNLAAFFLLLFITACSTNPAAKIESYAGLGKPTDQIPFMENVRTGKLPNGLTYFILENAKPENRAFLTMAVDAGSVQEQDDEQGLAHFVEHMAFNGTEHFPKSELIDYLRSLGMRFGPEVNAYTSFDETVYGIEVPVEVSDSGKKIVPAKAIQVISDWSNSIKFLPEDVDAERSVIMEEYRTRLNADMRVWKKTLPIIYEDTLYAKRDPIGLPEIIQTAPAQKLVDFYKRWYRPDNMALIFVGDFDGAVLEAELENYFNADAPSSVLEKPHYDLPIPVKGKFRTEIITDPELTFTRADFYFKMQPSVQGTDFASYREGLIENLISRMVSIRFNDEASKPETPFAAAGAYTSRYAYASRYCVMAGIAKPGLIKETMNALLLEKESMERFGFTQAEIDLAKRSLMSDMEQIAAEQDKQESSSYINQLTNYYLSGESLPSINWELNAVQKLLPGITQKEISASAKNFFVDDDLTVIISAPSSDAASLPNEVMIQEMISAAANADIEAPQEETFSDELISDTIVPGNITNEIIDNETDVTEWTLSNGAKVLFLPTKNQNNEISFYALANGGISSASDEEYYSVSVAADMFNYSGAGDFSNTELLKKLAGKQISLSFWLSSYIRGFQGASSSGDVETLFQLLYLGFTQPKINRDAASFIIDQYRTILAQRQENPEAYFFDEVQKVMYSNYPKTLPMTLADLGKVSVDQAEAFIKKSINPADYTFIFTGNIDEATLKDFTETYLASIPASENAPFNTWTDMNIPLPGKQEKNLYKGQEEKSVVFMEWIIPMEYSEKDSINAAVLNEYLSIRLTEEIREKLGGVYSISPSVGLTPMPNGTLSLIVTFYCDPNRAEDLAAAVQTELNLIVQGNVNLDTLVKSQEALKKTFEQSIQSNSYLARNIANYNQIFDAPFSLLYDRPEFYDSVQAGDLQRLANLLQENGGPLKMILYPEN